MRVHFARGALFVSAAVVERTLALRNWIREGIQRFVTTINSRSVVHFTRGENVEALNRAALYVMENEQTNCLIVVHVYQREEDIPANLPEHSLLLRPPLPEVAHRLHRRERTASAPRSSAPCRENWRSPCTAMSIGTPGDEFPHRIEELGGVRLIL